MTENNKDRIYLGKVNTPDDLKKLPCSDIEPLCKEIREIIVDTVEKNGGHLASNLGVVELSVAIHRVFNSPHDHIIFDVGHQSYTHKLLTNRFKEFDTLRKAGGISGFTNREESPYDCFGAGHSSTSVSAALGFAEADKLSGSDAYTVVVLGDGAFTGGMVHEALNNCSNDLRLIIILNENEMSISKNIGRFANSMAKLRRKKGYFKFKRFIVSTLKKTSFGKLIFRGLRKLKKSVKNSLYGSNYFEDMGLYYLGPADGNNYKDVERLLLTAKEAGESVLIHLKTKKGKGYMPAEQDPGEYHGIRPSGKDIPEKTFSSEFGKTVCELAENNDKICAITAAMSSGTGLDEFAKTYPERFFDVGIAEEHAVTFAAGLAANGYKPIFAVYSTFLQRGYDQIIHDVALQKLPVVFCVDRAGFNESDGATHHGIFDVSFASQLPNLKIYTPITYVGARLSLNEAINSNVPSIIRYPSGSEQKNITNSFYSDGRVEKIGVRTDFSMSDKPKNIVITYGRIANEALEAKKLLEKENLSLGIILCEYLSPYDSLADEIGKILEVSDPDILLFLEEEIKCGGFAMNLCDTMKKKEMLVNKTYDILATEDPFVTRTIGETYIKASGIDRESIAGRIISLNKKY